MAKGAEQGDQIGLFFVSWAFGQFFITEGSQMLRYFFH
jgi:hypothetical protein